MSEAIRNGHDKPEPFVDLEIGDNFVVLSGTRLDRTEIAKGVSPEDWRLLWDKVHERLAARGSMKGVRDAASPTRQMDLFRKMVERG